MASSRSPRRRAVVLATVAFFIGSLLLATAASASTLTLRVVGHRLVDASGKDLMLRGANLSGTEFSCVLGGTPTKRGTSIFGNQPLDQASTYAAMATWDVNVVRVPLNEDCWLGINGVNPSFGGAKYITAIQTEVTRIHQAGMYAILDLHWTSPGRFAAYAQQEMADADHSVKFWASVAGAFKNDGAVIFDLFNEPYFYWIADGTSQWDCWLNGCAQNQFVSAGQTLPDGTHTPYQMKFHWRTTGMNQLIAAVRGAGAANPIMANGVGWGSDVSGWLTHQPIDPLRHLIAGFHDYPGQCDPASCIPATVVPIAKKVPVLLGETGDSITSPVTWVDRLLPTLDADRIGYLGWTWNPWTGFSSNVLIADWNGTPTTNYGQYFRRHLLAVAPHG